MQVVAPSASLADPTCCKWTAIGRHTFSAVAAERGMFDLNSGSPQTRRPIAVAQLIINSRIHILKHYNHPSLWFLKISVYMSWIPAYVCVCKSVMVSVFFFFFKKKKRVVQQLPHRQRLA
jgi:hypothetical protein